MVTVPVMVVMMAMLKLMVVAMPMFEIVLVARHSHVFYRSPIAANPRTPCVFPVYALTGSFALPATNLSSRRPPCLGGLCSCVANCNQPLAAAVGRHYPG